MVESLASINVESNTDYVSNSQQHSTLLFFFGSSTLVTYLIEWKSVTSHIKISSVFHSFRSIFRLRFFWMSFFFTVKISFFFGWKFRFFFGRKKWSSGDRTKREQVHNKLVKQMPILIRLTNGLCVAAITKCTISTVVELWLDLVTFLQSICSAKKRTNQQHRWRQIEKRLRDIVVIKIQWTLKHLDALIS